MIIAIDGMSATGKSTLAFMLAQKYGLTYLNSGSIYRCIALKKMNNEIDVDSLDIDKNVLDLNLEFKIVGSKQYVYLDNKDVTDIIRSEKISVFTPQIANISKLKNGIRMIQKKFVDKGNVVIEGRDIGTRIAPNADYKFYLYSSLDKRASRLYDERKSKENITYKEIYDDLQNRDLKDIKDGNFIKPVNAIEIDTSNLSVDEVFEKMCSYIREEK